MNGSTETVHFNIFEEKADAATQTHELPSHERQTAGAEHEIDFGSEAQKLAAEIASGQLNDEEVRALCVGRLFSLYVPHDEDQIATRSVIELMYGLRLADVYDTNYSVETRALGKHYGSHMSGSAFAGLIGPLLLDMAKGK